MKNHHFAKKEAVALSYDSPTDYAPKVIAKGRGEVANNILENAKKFNIPIQEDPTLVELLGQLEINETIPEELYQIVAELFAFIYRIDKMLENNEK
ncbi:MAG TPA: EscU/YscU/HrcU family type III secretion system export apparatus switch protein [Bacillus bacterium]|nr:EscU/YscU/HrcU family type III secretion system export apparatus switch protein [Bacillus sp. (in: firmicutes)]